MRNYINIRKDVAKAKPAEELFRQRLAKAWNLKVHYNPDRFIVDFSVTTNDDTNRIVALVEIKVRNFKHDAFPSYFVGIRKFTHGVNYYNATGIPFILGFAWADGVDTFYKYNPKDRDLFVFTHSGRTKQQRDNQDISPVIHIPRELFKIL
tara:strand:- start:7443 stop:7895 length:453 start_codon:yes stop_codon:yes gene_type:complete